MRDVIQAHREDTVERVIEALDRVCPACMAATSDEIFYRWIVEFAYSREWRRMVPMVQDPAPRCATGSYRHVRRPPWLDPPVAQGGALPVSWFA